MNKKANALANYLENSGMITGSSDSEFGKTTTLSISLPTERYCLLKELSSRFNVSMTQLVNISLNGFESELLFSFSDYMARDIATKVDAQIEKEIDSSERVCYWGRQFDRELERRDYEDFERSNPNLNDEQMAYCYSEMLAQRANGGR